MSMLSIVLDPQILPISSFYSNLKKKYLNSTSLLPRYFVNLETTQISSHMSNNNEENERVHLIIITH